SPAPQITAESNVAVMIGFAPASRSQLLDILYRDCQFTATNLQSHDTRPPARAGWRAATMRKAIARHLAALALAVVVAGTAWPAATAATAAGVKPFRVVTTFTVIRDIAQNVAGDKATVESITKPGAEIHDYQPT